MNEHKFAEMAFEFEKLITEAERIGFEKGANVIDRNITMAENHKLRAELGEARDELTNARRHLDSVQASADITRAQRDRFGHEVATLRDANAKLYDDLQAARRGPALAQYVNELSTARFQLAEARAELERAYNQQGVNALATNKHIAKLTDEKRALEKRLVDVARLPGRASSGKCWAPTDPGCRCPSCATVPPCVGEPPPATHIDTVVLPGWNGMTMTQDHNGTTFRRTS